MKKQYFFAPLYLLVMFGLFSFVSAEEVNLNANVEVNTSTGSGQASQKASLEMERQKMRMEMDARREAMRVEAEARREEMKTRRIEFQQDIAKRKVEYVTRVILATIERLEKIAVRIESRITKVKAEGGDTSSSEASVALARQNLLDARASVATFVTLDLSNDKARENFERIRTAASTTRELIRSAHQNLMKAVRALGAVKVKVEINTSAEAE